MTMNTIKDEAQKVAAELEGTCCQSFARAVADYPLLSAMDELDAQVKVEQEGDIFLCDQCGWWCSNDERGTDGQCNDCSDADEEDDEE